MEDLTRLTTEVGPEAPAYRNSIIWADLIRQPLTTCSRRSKESLMKINSHIWWRRVVI